MTGEIIIKAWPLAPLVLGLAALVVVLAWERFATGSEATKKEFNGSLPDTHLRPIVQG